MAPRLSLGTDCSGMETPAMALQNLGVSVEHQFSCDVNGHAKATILANYPPKIFYDDIVERDNAKAPKTDLYVAGFPCQPFSMYGMKQGFADKAGRGTIFFRVRDYIEKQKPKVFVLENVRGLVGIDGGSYFKAILASLEELGCYNVYHQILNTRDHGVPQCRNRIYIVGIKKSCDKGTFQFPQPLARVSIASFLDRRTTKPTMSDLPPKSQSVARANVVRVLKDLKAKGHDPLSESWVIDVDSSPNRVQAVLDGSMCLTCGRCDGHWITSRGRRATKMEMLRLQGMNTPAEGFKIAVSERQLGRQLGNAMSCNVLERLFVRLLPAAGLAAAASLHDRWEARAGGRAPSTPPRQLKRARSDTPEPTAKRPRGISKLVRAKSQK